MNAHQRQRLVTAGFSRKGLDDAQFILDRTPASKHNDVVALLTTPRQPVKSTSREMTKDEIRQRQANRLPGTDADIAALVGETIGDEVRAALDRIRGRVN